HASVHPFRGSGRNMTPRPAAASRRRRLGRGPAAGIQAQHDPSPPFSLMRESMASVVYPVLLRGLRLRERLDAGDQPDLDLERAARRGLLGPAAEAPPWGARGGGPRAPAESINVSRGPWAPPDYLYALVCWLDEIFIDDSAWGRRWQNQLLEWALYKS